MQSMDGGAASPRISLPVACLWFYTRGIWEPEREWLVPPGLQCLAGESRVLAAFDLVRASPGWGGSSGFGSGSVLSSPL